MSRKPNFKIAYKDDLGRATVNLTALADAWRRHAVFDRPKLAARFNRLVKELCEASAYHFGGSYRDWPVDPARKIVNKLVQCAQENKVDRLILPIERESQPGVFLNETILQHRTDDSGFDGQVAVELWPQDRYVSVLQTLGKIDEKRSTPIGWMIHALE